MRVSFPPMRLRAGLLLVSLVGVIGASGALDAQTISAHPARASPGEALVRVEASGFGRDAAGRTLVEVFAAPVGDWSSGVAAVDRGAAMRVGLAWLDEGPEGQFSGEGVIALDGLAPVAQAVWAQTRHGPLVDARLFGFVATPAEPEAGHPVTKRCACRDRHCSGSWCASWDCDCRNCRDCRDCRDCDCCGPDPVGVLIVVGAIAVLDAVTDECTLGATRPPGGGAAVLLVLAGVLALASPRRRRG